MYTRQKWVVNFKYILVDVDDYSEEGLLKTSNVISLIVMMDQSIVAKDKKILIRRLEEIVKAKDKLPSEKLALLYEWLKEVLLARFPLEEGMRIIESMKEGKSMTYAIERLFDNIEEQGRKEGMEKGMEKGIEKIVKNAIKKGMKLEDIVELTDLTREDIEKIRQQTESVSP